MTTDTDRRDAVYGQLVRVIDPEIGDDIVHLGLVYDVHVDDQAVEVVMTVTTRGCPMQDALANGVRTVVRELPWVDDVVVRIVWDPPWHPGLMRRNHPPGGSPAPLFDFPLDQSLT